MAGILSEHGQSTQSSSRSMRKRGSAVKPSLTWADAGYHHRNRSLRKQLPGRRPRVDAFHQIDYYDLAGFAGQNQHEQASPLNLKQIILRYIYTVYIWTVYIYTVDK